MEGEVTKAREESIKAVKKKKKAERVKAEGREGERKREKEGRMSPMAATHHSQLNDAVFFPPSPASFPWERGGREFGPHPIKRGHAEFTTSRWDCPPPGKRVCVCVCSYEDEEMNHCRHFKTRLQQK